MESIRINLLASEESHVILVDEPELPNLTRDTSNYENLIYQLNAMGFEAKKIETAISYAEAKSIGEALTFLIKGENGWEHEFIRN